MCSGWSTDHSPRNVQECAATPAGGVQGGELVDRRIDRAEQVLADQLGVLVDQRIEAAEDDAALGPLGVERRSKRLTVQR